MDRQARKMNLQQRARKELTDSTQDHYNTHPQVDQTATESRYVSFRSFERNNAAAEPAWRRRYYRSIYSQCIREIHFAC